MLGGESWDSPRPILLGSVAFSGFFTYEICRKLDPTLPKVYAHSWKLIYVIRGFFIQIKGTYLVVYGKWPTFGFTMATIFVGTVSSYLIGLNKLLWPLEGLMIMVM